MIFHYVYKKKVEDEVADLGIDYLCFLSCFQLFRNISGVSFGALLVNRDGAIEVSVTQTYFFALLCQVDIYKEKKCSPILYCSNMLL